MRVRKRVLDGLRYGSVLGEEERFLDERGARIAGEEARIAVAGLEHRRLDLRGKASPTAVVVLRAA